MRLLLLFILFISQIARAQVVTASFNKFSLATNPAAVATRDHSFFSISANRENSLAKIKQQDTAGNASNLREELTINKKEFIFAGVGKRLSSELYFSFDDLNKVLQLATTSGGQKDKSNITFTNNMANISFKYSQRLFFGIKVFAPAVKYNQNLNFTYEDGTSNRSKGNYKSSYIGLGAGVTLKLTQNTFFALYYNKTSIKTSGTGSFTDTQGQTTANKGNDSIDYATKGAGLAFERGDTRTKAVRVELSYSTMDFPINIQPNSGQKKFSPVRIYAAMEFAIWGVIFGGNIKYTKGPFRDSLNIVKDSAEDPIISEQFRPTYEYFFAFVSKKGHGIGINGSYSEGVGDKYVFGAPLKAKIISSTMGLNYSYTF